MNNFPDKERIMGQVHEYAEAARKEGHAPDVVEYPAPREGTIAPIYMGKEHEIVPERYVIHYAFVQCKNCGAATRESEFYALSYIRSRVTGARVRHLTKCSSAQYNIPVDKILTGCSKIPYCQECDKIDLSHLPPPPQATSITNFPEMQFKGHRKPTAASGKTSTDKPSPAPRAKPTLDDLI